MAKRLQNRIAESRRALTVTAAYALLVCLASPHGGPGPWGQAAILLGATLLMVVLNNSNSLIRIYSRMVSCSFLVLTTMSTFLFASCANGLLQLSFIAFFLSLFRAYQNPDASGWVFYAFCAIGVASTLFGQIVFLVPVLWILLATNILAFSARTFLASLLGLVAPYWFVAAYCALTGNLHALPQHFMGIVQFGSVLDWALVDLNRLVTFAFILLVSLVGATHFFLFSYLDKIKTRMLYELFIVVEAALVVCILLQPQQFDKLLSLLIVTSAPIAGHFLVLSHSRLSNAAFFLFAALALAITAFNLWMPSSRF